jgi:hypothetical protein
VTSPSASPEDASPRSQLLDIATLAVEFHDLLIGVRRPEAASRAELDDLHRLLTALYELVDDHARATRPRGPAEADHLRAARIRVWQAAEHLHDAYHAAPSAGRRLRPPGDRGTGVTICRRHLATAVRVRRQTTPAELRSPFTGLIRRQSRPTSS